MKNQILLSIFIAVAALGVPRLTFADTNLLKNPSFEEKVGSGDEATNIPSWTKRWDLKPIGVLEVNSATARTGKQSLAITNSSGLLAHTYEGVAQLLEGLDPAKTYTFSFWGKGKITGGNERFGVSDDAIGNVMLSLMPDMKSSDDWVKYQLTFQPTAEGKKYVILMSFDYLDDYHIDDASVTEAR